MARRSIAKRLYEKGYCQYSVNNILKALDLPVTGIPITDIPLLKSIKPFKQLVLKPLKKDDGHPAQIY